MELIGKIHAVMPKRTGDTERGHWESQQYVLHYFDPDDPRDMNGKYMVFSVFGADRIANFNLEQYREYKIFFDIDANESKKNPGQWFNDIRAWKVEPTSDTQASEQTIGNPSGLI